MFAEATYILRLWDNKLIVPGAKYKRKEEKKEKKREERENNLDDSYISLMSSLDVGNLPHLCNNTPGI